ncbi:MAG TPA: phosphatase PAP2 family protein, partial [Longimicrobium sp.]|nr:phosphatase PAP2 family protein [Longimicrobium sp.]
RNSPAAAGMNKADSTRHADERREGRRRALALGAVAGAAAAGFAALAAAVARRDTAKVDEAVRKATGADPDSDAHDAAESIKKAGKWYTYVPAAAAASTAVLLARGADGNGRSRRVGAGALMLTGTLATALNPAFDKVLPQPPAPPGHPSRSKAVFPSGHAFGPGAVSLATAYVLSREGVAHPAIAFPAALAVPAVTAGARMLVQKHWASDVLGGLVGGIAVAALCLSAYEATRLE